ncbi:Peptidoglycan/LPS O-acetylase OafA/YrhL, contains acyltransferase and SGNH-hydrolase domains [Klenkia soli]|uniref:Peptidoglycan/LPS O-acetylase OafA/YrhL, contains acyltransferase and SGNH-hydrolase domains n=1 Tax=Klenkia soli TaxID=1052260 RepID=A0A1H0H7T0_9ACTN|nr:acyltransferase family protein [Klenkia soli]SDO15198.1 Peptidoglycan/LPS O-acetylase OafA/YrhL, contains acyltransferase and SGNH-hydrolase domains [Klenkia soli]
MHTSTLPVATLAPARRFLPEVQALRAVAVLLVVVYHLWPLRLHGGFVGVDVFFVISGFLITSHLDREVQRTGRVSLPQFYARRARRLLPASMLVLVSTVVASVVFLPDGRWATTAHEVLASAFYVQNWALADRAVDYSALTDAASPVQHFWSLSVEEQFYLVWPGLVLLLVAVAVRRGRAARSLLVPGIAVVTAVSFAVSVWMTADDPAAAYFVTPTRVWELGVGALLALVTARLAERRGRRHAAPAAGDARWPVVLRWAGITAVLAAAVALSSASPFPGWLAAIPVLGTAAVIAAGDGGRRDPLLRVAGWGPVQFVGSTSYSMYLWHWPLIVVVPVALGRPMAWTDKIVLFVVALGLAWATKVWVEDRGQRWSFVAVRPRRTFAVTAAAMAVVAGLAVVQLQWLDQRTAVAAAQVASAEGDPCFGAGALDPARTCTAPFGPPISTTLPEEERPWFSDDACDVDRTGPIEIARCRWGTTEPTRRVVLVGDSHAEMWRGAIHALAERENWELDEILLGGCPAADARVATFDGSPIDTGACLNWGQEATRYIAATEPDDVFTSSFASAYGFEDGPEAGVQGYADIWDTWADLGAAVHVLQDIPRTGGVQMPECVAAHADDPAACATPRATAFPADPAREAVGLAGDRVQSVDLTDRFCDADRCYAVIGGAQVYWDVNHMTALYSRSLADAVGEATGLA